MLKRSPAIWGRRHALRRTYDHTTGCISVEIFRSAPK